MNEQFAQVWQELKKNLEARNYAKTSVEDYHRYLPKFFWFLESRGIQDVRRVSRETLEAYQFYLAESKTTAGTVFKWSTQCTLFRPVRKLFEWLESTRQILVNPAEGLHDPRPECRLPKNVMTEEQVRRLLETPDTTTVQGFRDRAILEVFYSTGIRLEEMLNLKLEDCDTQEGFVRVNLGKGAKDRVVPLGETARKYLKAYIEEVRPKLSAGHPQYPNLWLLWREGRPLSKQIVGQRVSEYGKQAKIEVSVTAHGLRHSFATHLVKNGADIVAVSKMMGHYSPRVTQMYAHVAGVDVKRAHEEYHPREKDAPENTIPALVRLVDGHA
jgi:integrase/recombinase XerD